MGDLIYAPGGNLFEEVDDMFWLMELMFRRVGNLVELYGGWEGLKQNFSNAIMPYDRLVMYTVWIMALAPILAIYPFGIDWLPQRDLHGLNISLAIFVNLVYFAVLMKVNVALKVGGLAFIASRFDSERGFLDYLEILKQGLVNWLFFVTMYLLIFGVVPFRRDPVAIVLIGAGLLAVLHRSLKYKTSAKWVGYLIDWFPFMVVMTGVLRILIQDPYYVKFEAEFGWNPKEVIALGPRDIVEVEILKINKELRRQAYDKITMQLKVYRERIEGGQGLSPVEMEDYLRLIGEYNELNRKYGSGSALHDFDSGLKKKEKKKLRAGVSFRDVFREANGEYYWEGIHRLDRKGNGAGYDRVSGRLYYLATSLEVGDFVEFRPGDDGFDYSVLSVAGTERDEYVQRGLTGIAFGKDVPVRDMHLVFPVGSIVESRVYRKRRHVCAVRSKCLVFERIVDNVGVPRVAAKKSGADGALEGYVIKKALTVATEVMDGQTVRFDRIGDVFQYLVREPMGAFRWYEGELVFRHGARVGGGDWRAGDDVALLNSMLRHDANEHYLVYVPEGKRLRVQVYGNMDAEMRGSGYDHINWDR